MSAFSTEVKGDPVGMTDEKTQGVLNFFKEINEFPRCFMYDRNMGVWLQKWAEVNGYPAEGDTTGNVVIRVPATKGYEKASTIVLQSHMDMVCEKSSDSAHDFFKDPVRLIREGEWLKADKTTLGADDGIGMALAFAMAKDPAIKHPPLELLFTVGEESGMRGANALYGGFIQGRVLINLDSEEEGAITIGSAGGLSTAIVMQAKPEKLPSPYGIYVLKVDGLQGGHSGVDIHRKRGNAIKILDRALETIIKNRTELRLVDLKGGSRLNAIPRQAAALIAFKPERFKEVLKTVKDVEQIMRQEYALTDKGLTITLSALEKDKPDKGFTPQDSSRAVSLLGALPDGVAAMDPYFKGMVETSNNLGTIETNAYGLTIMSNQRSSDMARLEELTNKIRQIAAGAGAWTKDFNGYEPWLPNLESNLLKRGKEVYRKLYGREPIVAVVHGGLECGLISAKCGGLDIIAVGPTIEGAHSPSEKLYIPSIGKVREFLAALLATYK
jgi:dipeptidase D